METSAFLYENLSYSLLIWLHFGTSMLISFSVFLYVIPILYNIVVLYLPSFKYGFKETGAGAGGAAVIPMELIKTLKDSKVFAGIFSRNPKLFSQIPMEESKKFFVNLDEKIDKVLDNIKGLPTSEDEEKKDEDQPSTEGQSTLHGGSSTSVGGQGKAGDATGSGESVSEDGSDKQLKKSKKTKLLVYGNLVFVVVIVVINVYSFIYYNGILNEYFVVKKGMLKNSGDDYGLVYSKLKGVDSVKVELIKEINNYVEIINSVKQDKRSREAKEAAEEEKEGKK